jgi:hypothetical protein
MIEQPALKNHVQLSHTISRHPNGRAHAMKASQRLDPIAALSLLLNKGRTCAQPPN